MIIIHQVSTQDILFTENLNNFDIINFCISKNFTSPVQDLTGQNIDININFDKLVATRGYEPYPVVVGGEFDANEFDLGFNIE